MNVRMAILAGGILSSAIVATALIGPEPLAGQSAQAPDSSPSADAASTPDRPQYFLPAGRQRPIYAAANSDSDGGGVRHAQQLQPGAAGAAPAGESEVQRQLRLLYEKSGRRMPEMDINRVPTPSQQRRVTAQGRDITRRKGGRPFLTNKKSSPLDFLKKLNPFDQDEPPRRRIVVPSPAGYGQANPMRRIMPPSRRFSPESHNPAQLDRRVAPVTPRFPPATQPQVVRQQQRPAETTQQNSPPKAPSTSAQTEEQGQKMPVLFDESTTPAKPLASDPFPNQSEQQADTKTPAAPSETQGPALSGEGSPASETGTADDSPFVKSGEPAEDNPYVKAKPATDTQPPGTGQEPELKIESAQDQDRKFRATRKTVKRKTEPSSEIQPTVARDNPHADKMRRIVARRGTTGFRGFCPVTLRDQRDLADGQPEYRAKFEGRSYFFSSEAARKAFVQSPEKYAPAKMGLDVVRLAEGGESVEGSLEHAAWYKDRLYFFTNATSLRIFVRNPGVYVAN